MKALSKRYPQYFLALVAGAGLCLILLIGVGLLGLYADSSSLGKLRELYRGKELVHAVSLAFIGHTSLIIGEGIVLTVNALSLLITFGTLGAYFAFSYFAQKRFPIACLKRRLLFSFLPIALMLFFYLLFTLILDAGYRHDLLRVLLTLIIFTVVGFFGRSFNWRDLSFPEPLRELLTFWGYLAALAVVVGIVQVFSNPFTVVWLVNNGFAAIAYAAGAVIVYEVRSSGSGDIALDGVEYIGQGITLYPALLLALFMLLISIRLAAKRAVQTRRQALSKLWQMPLGAFFVGMLLAWLTAVNLTGAQSAVKSPIRMSVSVSVNPILVGIVFMLWAFAVQLSIIYLVPLIAQKLPAVYRLVTKIGFKGIRD